MLVLRIAPKIAPIMAEINPVRKVEAAKGYEVRKAHICDYFKRCFETAA